MTNFKKVSLQSAIAFTAIIGISWTGSCAEHSKYQHKKKEIVGEVKVRTSAQKDVATANDIIDNTFIVIGGKAPIAQVDREEVDGKPVYKFQATGKANRIEFSTCFGAEENLKGISDKEIELLKKVKSAYEYSDQGKYGETITYQWKARFPEKLQKNTGGIFAQWHGRPDRTLVQSPDGELNHISKEKFVNMLDTMSFKKNVGYSNKTKKPNGWLVDNSAGGPIGAFHFRNGMMYLMVRSEASRISDPTFKVKPKPGQHLNKVIGRKGKTGSIVFERPASQIPINEWIEFKVKIKYSEYSQTEDKVLSSGFVQVWMNDKQVADWKGDIGKNDLHGPYFKFGIYKPGKDGFKVDCKDYVQTIER